MPASLKKRYQFVKFCRNVRLTIKTEFSLGWKLWVTQSCPTLCDPMNWRLPGSSFLGILQARILEWVANLFCRGSSWPRDQTRASSIAGRFFTSWATREAVLLQANYFISVSLKKKFLVLIFSTLWYMRHNLK